MGSLGTKANMGALKLGNFSHNASLRKLTTEVKALGVTVSGVVLQTFYLAFHLLKFRLLHVRGKRIIHVMFVM